MNSLTSLSAETFSSLTLLNSMYVDAILSVSYCVFDIELIQCTHNQLPENFEII